MSKDAFTTTTIAEPRAYAMAQQTNERGYVLTAIRTPYYDDTLEFVQVDFPDGTTAYFTLDADVAEGFRAGPFGGGYSWACPKYVVKAVGELLHATFDQVEEKVTA